MVTRFRVIPSWQSTLHYLTIQLRTCQAWRAREFQPPVLHDRRKAVPQVVVPIKCEPRSHHERQKKTWPTAHISTRGPQIPGEVDSDERDQWCEAAGESVHLQWNTHQNCSRIQYRTKNWQEKIRSMIRPIALKSIVAVLLRRVCRPGLN